MPVLFVRFHNSCFHSEISTPFFWLEKDFIQRYPKQRKLIFRQLSVHRRILYLQTKEKADLVVHRIAVSLKDSLMSCLSISIDDLNRGVIFISVYDYFKSTLKLLEMTKMDL